MSTLASSIHLTCMGLANISRDSLSNDSVQSSYRSPFQSFYGNPTATEHQLSIHPNSYTENNPGRQEQSYRGGNEGSGRLISLPKVTQPIMQNLNPGRPDSTPTLPSIPPCRVYPGGHSTSRLYLIPTGSQCGLLSQPSPTGVT